MRRRGVNLPRMGRGPCQCRLDETATESVAAVLWEHGDAGEFYAGLVGPVVVGEVLCCVVVRVCEEGVWWLRWGHETDDCDGDG